MKDFATRKPKKRNLAKKKSAFRSTRQTSNIISKNSIFILLVISSCLVITSFFFFKTDIASTNPEDVFNNVTIDFPSSLLEDSVLIESDNDSELSCEYFVQIGAYGNKKYALEAEKMLMGEIQNISIDIVYSTQLPGKPLNSVISGPYENRSAANNAREKITKRVSLILFFPKLLIVSIQIMGKIRRFTIGLITKIIHHQGLLIIFIRIPQHITEN